MTSQTETADTLEMTVAVARLLRTSPPIVCEATHTVHLKGSGWQMQLQPEALPNGEMLATLYVYLCTYLNPAIRAHGAFRYIIHPEEYDPGVYTLTIDGRPVLASTAYADVLVVFNNLTGRTYATDSATYAQYIAWLDVQYGQKVEGLDARIDTEGWVVAGPDTIPLPVGADKAAEAEEVSECPTV